MLDDLNKRPSGEGQRESARTPVPASPMVDREVPIVAATPFEAMHRWLDGEGAEAAALADAESARYVALWRRVGQETASRRSSGLSADFAERVMRALPGGDAEPLRADLRMVPAAPALAAAPAVSTAAPAPRVAQPTAAPSAFWERPLEVNGTTALVAGAALLGLGALLGAALRGQ